MSRSLIYHTHLSISGNVTLKTSNGASTEAQFDSISKSGLVLHCDQAALKELFPRTPSVSLKQTVDLDVDFGLPEVGRIMAACHVTSLRRMSRTKFELQMNFAEAGVRSLNALEHYVERKLRASNAAAENAQSLNDNVHQISNSSNETTQRDLEQRVA
jgi:hypothetical protein